MGSCTLGIRALQSLLAVTVAISVLGCAGATTGVPEPGSTSSTVSPVVHAGAALPERLQAVMGRTATPDNTYLVWCLTREGIAQRELPVNHAVTVGGRGSTIVYSDLDTGKLYLWHPGSTDDLFAIDVPRGAHILGDAMALSPDERTLVLVRNQSSEEVTDGSEPVEIRGGYIIDLESGQVAPWEWLESAAEFSEVTALRWDKTSSSVCVSFGYAGGDRGVKSYAHELLTRRVVEIEGVATVFDIGPGGQVLGLGVCPLPGDPDFPGGSQIAYPPLVLWHEGELLRMPTDPSLQDFASAWMSDDGGIIVVKSAVSDCLMVLELRDAGWEVGRVFRGDDSVRVLRGIGFEPNSGVFCFEGESTRDAAEGLDGVVGLYEFETTLGQVYYPPVTLPGGSDDYSFILGIVGAEDCDDS